MKQWKSIVGYEGLYEVSNTGLVRSVDRIGWNGYTFHNIKGRILKTGNTKSYSQITLSKNNMIYRTLAHRLVALHFLDNPNNYPYVCHRDNNPSNNSVDNLYWGTQSMNILQCSADGRMKHSRRRK